MKDFLPQHTESGFSHCLYEDDSKIFILEGRIDLLALMDGSKIVVDHKFQGRRTRLYDKSIQFRNYTFASGYSLMLVNYLRLTKGITSDTYERQVISFNTLEREWWRRELIKIYEKIYYDKIERNWSSCIEKYGQVCQYASLCNEQDPMIREAKMSQNYTHADAYTPW